MQPARYPYRHPQTAPRRRPPHGMRRIATWVAIILFAVIFLRVITGRTVAAIPQVQSGVTGYCLNAHEASSGAEMVDTQACDSSQSQQWTVGLTSIQHTSNTCLEVAGSRAASGSKIVASNCNNGPAQVWLRDGDGFINPNSQLCLALPGGKTGGQLIVASCDRLNRASEQWYAVSPSARSTVACPSTKGERIACYAIQEWTAWQANPANRNNLLQQYTDNASYEEWCADFISYVYREAGYPFTSGVDGWDINEANDIQSQGFTEHDPANYTPQPGDVAYFNYDGGHVEIVVVGGKHPTFIYGNSGDIDPVTGNGTMKANTITDDGDAGHLMYYLSPNQT